METGYNQRIILFVDILGFASKVKKSAHSAAAFNSLKNTLEYIKSLFHKAPDIPSDLEVFQFSDSLVISLPADSPGGVLFMVSHAGFAMHALFTNGYACKGNITVGAMHHQKEILFGPGFLEAMRMEALEDRPLIKFGEELLQLAVTYPTPAQEGFEKVELGYIMSHAEPLDDATYQIAWFKNYGDLVGGGNEDTLRQYQEIKSLIEEGITQAPSIRVLAKYLYLKDAFNKSSYLKYSFPEGIITMQKPGFYRRKFAKHLVDSVASWLTRLYWKNK